MKTRLALALLPLALFTPLCGDEPVPPPLLRFAAGLPGKQVRLTWPAEPGVRYRIERSSGLGGGGTAGSHWEQVALVTVAGPEGEWLDPEPVTTKAFYRIVQPQPEVFDIPEPVLGPAGGVLVVEGQCLPADSSLVLTVDGVALEFPLENQGDGTWQATISGAFVPGAHAIATAVNGPGGATLVALSTPVFFTHNGRLIDSPGAPPLADPVAMFRPVPGIGIPVKKYGSGYHHRSAGGGIPNDDADEPLVPQDSHRQPPFLSRKGYQYYMAHADRTSGGVHNNPLYHGGGNSGQNPLYKGASERSGLLAPASSGLPGEVKFHHVTLAVPCPAGPPLEWVCTYRSLVPVDSGLGPGWDFSYNIAVEPVPAGDGPNAPRLRVRDGSGRADLFHRQADGSYRCDGLFREGRFDGSTFTLTFAGKGRWEFHPLDGSPAAGKIAGIIDRNGVALTCGYDSSGRLESVDDAFGRRLAVEWGGSPERILSVTGIHTTTSFTFAKATYTYSSGSERLASISAPFVPGDAPVAGPTSFSYSEGLADPRLNGNLRTIHDGAGRLLEGFSYATVTDPRDPAYDTCAAHDRNGGAQVRSTFALLPGGGYEMYQNDEVGRVTVSAFDKLHRLTRQRRHTGFATPDEPVTVLNLPDPSSRLRLADPVFFETTCAYNADSLCTRITHPDGSAEEIVYDRDFRADCPVLERGNMRVLSLLSSSGQKRTVRCDYLPGFGSPESARPGNPIGGLNIKGGRNPGGNAMLARDRGITLGTALMEYQGSSKLVWSPRSNYQTNDDSDWFADGRLSVSGGMPNRISMNVTTPKQSQGATFGERLAGQGCPSDDDCDDTDDAFRKLLDRGQAGDQCGMITRMVTAHGQSLTWTYDAHGNCLSALAALPGKGALYHYSPLGQCVSATELNGPGSSFTTDFSYDPASGFLTEMVCDPAGLAISASYERDAQGRITRAVDPRGDDWTFSYNPLGQCVSASGPEMPERISMTLAIDAAGQVVRRDFDHRLADGSLDPENPSYSTYYVYDARGRLTRVAAEEFPVDGSSSPTPEPLGIGNFSVCDFTYDAAGQCVRVSTPAACRGQAGDRVCDFTFDERGLPHRRIHGGAGTPAAVTLECDYDAYGSLIRETRVDPGGGSAQALFAYDGFQRPVSVIDPMGNETTLGYANDGTVTHSVFGEVLDLPGSAGNVLLASWRIRKRPEILFQAWDDAVARARSLTSSFADGDIADPNRTSSCCPSCRPVRCMAAFFDVDVEDDTVTAERFTPGESVPHATEVTVTDRSPAGLVVSVATNGDTVLTCGYDTAGRLSACGNGASSLALTRDKDGSVTVCGKTDHFLVAGMPDPTFTLTRAYDPLGRCVSMTDGTGNTTSYALDSLGRCVSLTEPGGLVLSYDYDGVAASGPYSCRIAADVDADGKPDVLGASLVRCGERVHRENSYGHRTSITRDPLGRITRIDHPDGTHEEMTHDSSGRPTGRRSRNGMLSALTYDLCGRLTSVSHDSGTLPEEVLPVAPTSYLYNGLGACVRAEQGGSVVERTWDSLGNAVAETQGGRTIARTFNHRGRSSVTYPDGRRFAETRDALGRVVSVSELDAVGLPLTPPVAVLQWSGTKLWRCIQANGTTTTHDYRADGAPVAGDFSFDTCVETHITDSSAQTLARIVRKRDANQRLHSVQTWFDASPQGPGRIHQYDRDVLGRMTGCLTRRREAAGAPPVTESEVSYVIGKEGMRVSEVRSGAAANYEQDGNLPPGDLQMDQYTAWPGGPLDWDEQGNLRSIHRSSVMHAGQYDAEGRLVSVTDPATGETLVTYTYDALDRRVASSTGGAPGVPPVVTEFVFDGTHCIQEWTDDGSGTLDAAVTSVSAGGIRHCISTRNGTLHYPAGTATRHWGDPHENLNGRHIKDWASLHHGDPHENLGGIALVTGAGGGVTERMDCDDAGMPVFLNAGGIPTGAAAATGPIRWMAPEAMWEPSIRMHLLGTLVFSPELGITVARGHVTVLKAAASEPGGGSGTGPSRAQDHNSSRSNKTASAAAAQDHNSSRSNKSSS
jgi:YD repeat-containing protein